MNPARMVLQNQFGEDSINVLLGSVLPLVPDSQVVLMGAAGAPVDGTTGDDIAAKGSIYINTTNGALYYQTGLISSPVWTAIGAGTTATLLTGLSAATGAIAAGDSVIQAFGKLLGLQRGRFTFDNIETVAAAGALSTLISESLINNASGSDFAVTLAAPSSQDGTFKVIKLGTATHAATLAMTNIVMSGGYTPAGSTTITFSVAGQSAVLMAVGTKWVYLGGSAVVS